MGKVEKLVALTLGIILFVLLSLFFTSFLVNQFKTISVVLGNIVTVVYVIIMYYYVTLYHKVINQLPRSSYLTFKINDFFLFFLGAGLCLALTMVHIGLVYHHTELGISQNYFELRNLIEVVLNNIVLSFLEELFFRVFIFISLLKIFRKFWLALIVSSLLFALLHLNGLDNQFIGIGLVHIFIGGCILTYLYYITNSIWSAIGFHSFNNIMNAVIYSLDDIMNLTVNTILYLTMFAILVYFGNKIKTGNQFKILSV